MTGPLSLTYVHDAPVAMGAVSAAIQVAKERKYMGLANASTVAGEIVWVKCDGTAAVVGQGVPIGPGAFWQPSPPPRGAIAGIAAAGAPNVVLTWG